MKTTQRTCLFAALLCAVTASALAEQHVGRDAEKGDPARWYEPADTPQRKHQALMKEAGAAQAEALKECRALGAERKPCEAQAREQYRRDVEQARSVLRRAIEG
jgi:hypothetical protein